MKNSDVRVPEIVGWEITSQCNLRCAHCFSAASRRPHDELSSDECRRIIDCMATLGVVMVGWTGGEPLMRCDLEELTEYAWDRGIRSNVTTNGVLLDRARAQRLIAAGCHTIQISLDGSTAEMNRRIRGTSDEEFDLIVQAIRTAKDLGARVVMASLVSRENLEDARKMIELGKREQVDAIRFCGFTPTGRGKHSSVKDRLLFISASDGLLDFVHAAQDQSSVNVEFDVGFGPVPPDYGFHECMAGMQTFYLKASGDVYPCTALAHRQFLIGNVRKRPLDEIWQSPEMHAMADFPRRQIQEPCRTCDNFVGCHGACRGSALAHANDLSAAFPVCLYQAEVRHRTSI
jgi:radical SAM protein with 4Fe4S-binding SPASM domain